MSAPDRGLQLLHTLTMVGAVMPPVEDMEEFVRESNTADSIGPVLYPDLYRRGEKRMRAARELCRAGVTFVRALEALHEATREESDPEADAAAQVMLRRFHERHGGGS